MKANLEFDLDDLVDRKRHTECCNSLDVICKIKTYSKILDKFANEYGVEAIDELKEKYQVLFNDEINNSN